MTEKTQDTYRWNVDSCAILGICGPYDVTAYDVYTVLEGKRSLYMPAKALAAE